MMKLQAGLKILKLSSICSLTIMLPMRLTEASSLELAQKTPFSEPGDFSVSTSSIETLASPQLLIADISCLFGFSKLSTGSATIIDRKQIEQQMALNRNVGDILRQEAPGVSPGLSRGRSRLLLRGKPAKILIDGVPVSADALINLDPGLVEQIEVIPKSNASRCD